jgi:signal transduction histidine kinase/tetratricopeptide (TPR) repeat protein
MKKNILLLVLLLQVQFTNAQLTSKAIDSVKQLLSTEKEDTVQVNLLYQLARAYSTSRPDTALLIAKKGLDLSQKIHFKKGEFNCLRTTGSIFVNMGNYPKALEIYLQVLRIAGELKDDVSIGSALNSLSDVYFFQGDIKRSVDYSQRGIAIYKKLKDSSGLSVVLTNLGDTYEKNNQLDSGLYYTMRSYLIKRSLKNGSNLIGTCLNNLGNVFLKLGKADSAMMYYKLGLPYIKRDNEDNGLCETYLGMARIFLQKNNTDSCLYYAGLSFDIAKNAGFTDNVLKASNFLAGYYKSIRNIDSAYAYQAATIAAKDSLFSQQKANEFQSMTYDEDMRLQQIEDAKEQARVKVKQNALIGGLITLLVIAFLLIRNNRQRKKAEIDNKARELSVQKDNLQQSYNNVERLGEIGRKITASLSVEKIIGTVYNNINSLMDAAVFGIGIYNDNLKRLEFPATYEDGKALPFYSNSVDDKNRFGPVCFSDSKEIIIGKLDEEYQDHIQEVLTPHEGGQSISIIFLPLIVKEKKLGVITVQSFRENAYSAYHLFMLRNIATYTAIAIENAESFETLNETVLTLKSTQSQLTQSEKMASLGELTAGIAHEIQNPLNFVNNFSEVNYELLIEMKDEMDKGNLDNAKEIANDIIKNEQKINHHGKRADAIVKGMLQHSRKSEGVAQPTDINALCDEYLRLSYHGLRAKDKEFNTTINTDFDESIGTINIIPQDIGRVFLNLYNNAFYAVNEKSKQQPGGYKPAVLVSTKKINDKVEMKVSDNGNGIPQSIAEKIFQPFFTTKPTGQGTGLGLSLSYDIIKAHGGEIKVETREGEGTTFIIMLSANS